MDDVPGPRRSGTLLAGLIEDGGGTLEIAAVPSVVSTN